MSQITITEEGHPSEELRSVRIKGVEVGYCPAAGHSSALQLTRHLSESVIAEIVELVSKDATITTIGNPLPQSVIDRILREYREAEEDDE